MQRLRSLLKPWPAYFIVVLELQKVTMALARDMRTLIMRPGMGTREGVWFTFSSGGKGAAPGHWWLAKEVPIVRCQVTLRIQAWKRFRDCPYKESLYFLQCALYLLKLSKTLHSSQAHQRSYFSVWPCWAFLQLPCSSEYPVLRNKSLLKKSTCCHVPEDWDGLVISSHLLFRKLCAFN